MTNCPSPVHRLFLFTVKDSIISTTRENQMERVGYIIMIYVCDYIIYFQIRSISLFHPNCVLIFSNCIFTTIVYHLYGLST